MIHVTVSAANLIAISLEPSWIMPKRRRVMSLYVLCLESITANISYWTEHYERHVLKRAADERKKILFVLGPFDDLSAPMANDLLQTLSQQKRISYPSLQLIINGGAITRIMLDGSAKTVNDSIVLSIAKSCSQIKQLSLRNCKRVTPATLHVLSTSLPQALFINLSNTAVDSQALSNIIQNCTNLLEFVLKGCKISDDMLIKVKQKALSDRTIKLRSLDISDTHRVTEKGIELLLLMMPHLQELHHRLLFDTICLPLVTTESHQERYSLRYISCVDADTALSDDHIKQLVTLCPSLYRLELRLTVELTNQGLQRLSDLAALRALALDGNYHDGGHASYAFRVKPVLESLGIGLNTLTLGNLKDLDLAEVMALCPNLESLTILQDCEPSNFKERGTPKRWQHPVLSDLCIWSRIGDSSLSELILASVLLSAVKLKHLELFQVDNFTGSILQRMVSDKTLTMLTSLKLKECNNITGHDLFELVLSETNSLAEISLIDNWLINRSDYETWKQMVKTSNLDVSVEWQ